MSTSKLVDFPLPPALPTTVEELDAMLKTKAQPNFNDLVHELYRKLWLDEKFRGYLYAVVDPQSKEGTTVIDDVMAALMIKDLAAKEGIYIVANANIASIIHGLRVVMNRHQMGRRQRKFMLEGQIVESAEEDQGDGTEL